jgi:hypothetical protein
MRKALGMVVGLAVVLALAVNAQADDKKTDKEVTLMGKLVCGKCTLKDKDCDTCTNVLQVKDGGKTVNYFIKDKGNKESYHKGSCKPDSSQNVKVTGTVTEKDGKKTIVASKVEIEK